MRPILFVNLVRGSAVLGLVAMASMAPVSGQSLMENAAAAAGGSVGGVAGKQVSDGLSAIFGKIDKDTSKAAKVSKRYSGPSEPAIEAGPGVPKNNVESVPPPPPLPRRGPAHKKVVAVALPPTLPVIEAPPPPPPPQMTTEELRAVTAGMNRKQLLTMGVPASRISMFEDGHLVELYLYLSKDTTLGEVRLSDGQVAGVQLR